MFSRPPIAEPQRASCRSPYREFVSHSLGGKRAAALLLTLAATGCGPSIGVTQPASGSTRIKSISVVVLNIISGFSVAARNTNKGGADGANEVHSNELFEPPRILERLRFSCVRAGTPQRGYCTASTPPLARMPVVGTAGWIDAGRGRSVVSSIHEMGNRSVSATGSSQWGQRPPGPSRRQGRWQSGHRCSPR